MESLISFGIPPAKNQFHVPELRAIQRFFDDGMSSMFTQERLIFLG
jgi:hypothetical protein